MLVIRSDQMRVFERDAERRERSELLEHLGAELPGVVAAHERIELEKMLDFAVRRAESHGLLDRTNIRQFVTLMFAVAPNFDRCPWFAILLADKRYDPDRRFEMLLLESSEEDWREAAEMSDGDWGLAKSRKAGR